MEIKIVNNGDKCKIFVVGFSELFFCDIGVVDKSFDNFKYNIV